MRFFFSSYLFSHQLLIELIRYARYPPMFNNISSIDQW